MNNLIFKHILIIIHQSNSTNHLFECNHSIIFERYLLPRHSREPCIQMRFPISSRYAHNGYALFDFAAFSCPVSCAGFAFLVLCFTRCPAVSTLLVFCRWKCRVPVEMCDVKCEIRNNSFRGVRSLLPIWYEYVYGNTPEGLLCRANWDISRSLKDKLHRAIK